MLPEVINRQVSKDIFKEYIMNRLSELEWQQKDLSEKTGIHKTKLSSIINGDRQATLDQIDLIARALMVDVKEILSHLAFHFYENGKIVASIKSTQFIIKCFKDGQLVLANKMTGNLIEIGRHDSVFTIANELYELNIKDEALKLFDILIGTETHKTANIAVCYFKRFMILRDIDLKVRGREALYKLLDYLEFLPDVFSDTNTNIQLDAYIRVLTYFNAVEDWQSLLLYAKKLEEKTNDEEFNAEALLYQAFAFQGMEKFEESISTINKYSKINDHYSKLGKRNAYLVYVEMGMVEYIEKYLDIIESESSIYTLLPLAMEAYLKNDLIDSGIEFINRFERQISDLGKSTFPPHIQRYLRFLCAKSALLIRAGKFNEGITDAIRSIEIAISIHNINRLTSCMSLIYKNYDNTSDNQKGEIQTMLERR